MSEIKQANATSIATSISSPVTLTNEFEQEPIRTLEVDGHQITLLGTAHISQASADKVKELIATGDQGKFRLGLEFDKSTSIQQNNLISEEIEEYILKQPYVATLFSNVGGPSSGMGSLGVGMANKSEFTIQLKPEKERNNLSTDSFMQSLRADLQNEYSGVNFSIVALGLIPRSAPIEITLSGIDITEVMNTDHDQVNQNKGSILKVLTGC